MGQLYTPTGKRIVGTLEKITGCAGITAAEPKNPDGTKEKFALDYGGGTEVYWNDQRTSLDEKTGERVFVDEDGTGWVESALELREDDEEE